MLILDLKPICRVLEMCDSMLDVLRVFHWAATPPYRHCSVVCPGNVVFHVPKCMARNVRCVPYFHHHDASYDRRNETTKIFFCLKNATLKG